MTTQQMREHVEQLLAAAGKHVAEIERSSGPNAIKYPLHVFEAVHALQACGILDEHGVTDSKLWRLLSDSERRFMLVYQGGLANVFEVDSFNLSPSGRTARRVYQGAFTQAIGFAQGLGAAGAIVRTASCNMAGDCATVSWTEGTAGTPFRDDLPDVRLNGGAIDATFVRARVGRDVRVVLDDRDVIGRLDSFDGRTLIVTQWDERRTPYDVNIAVVRNLLVRG